MAFHGGIVQCLGDRRRVSAINELDEQAFLENEMITSEEHERLVSVGTPRVFISMAKGARNCRLPHCSLRRFHRHRGQAAFHFYVHYHRRRLRSRRADLEGPSGDLAIGRDEGMNRILRCVTQGYSNE